MASLFDQKAAAYAAGRKGYAPAAVEKLLELLPRDAAAADMGSGTGIFAEQLIRKGILTHCIEPDDGMRAKADILLGGDPLYHAVAASAEETTLPDHSVDLVTAASALHWFDLERFKKECIRILKPNGIVGILCHVRDYDDPLTVKQHTLCEKYCIDFVSLAHGFEKISSRIPKLLREYEQIDFPCPLEYTVDDFVNRGLSSSYAPKPDHPHYVPYADALRQLAEKYAVNGVVRVANKTVLFVGKI